MISNYFTNFIMTEKKQDTRPVFMGTYLKHKTSIDKDIENLKKVQAEYDQFAVNIKRALIFIGVIAALAFCLAIL